MSAIPIPIEAIDAAAVTLQRLHQNFSIVTGQGRVLSRDMAEEWAQQMLEAVSLVGVRDWETCTDCGRQCRAPLWSGGAYAV